MKNILRLATLLLTISMLAISCGEDTPDISGCMDTTANNYNAEATIDDGSCTYIDVEGCMDLFAENYNADAVIDDGSCTYAGDKFIGDYQGASDCTGGTVIGGISNANFQFEITSQLTDNPNELALLLPIQGFPVKFNGIVNGNILNIDDVLTDIVFPDPSNPGSTIDIDLTGSGTLNYDTDNDIASGTITLMITSSATGATINEGSCLITGVKL